MSFIQYLNDYRLEIAAKLLTDSSDNIIDIAINTGFDNLSILIDVLRKNTVLLPGNINKYIGDF